MQKDVERHVIIESRLLCADIYGFLSQHEHESMLNFLKLKCSWKVSGKKQFAFLDNKQKKRADTIFQHLLQFLTSSIESLYGSELFGIFFVSLECLKLASDRHKISE